MYRVLCLFIFFSLNAWSYAPKDINLSTFEFNRYVKPQLISISQDYQTLVIALNPELKAFKPVAKKLQNIKEKSLSLNLKSSNKDLIIQKYNYLLSELNSIIKLSAKKPILHDKKYFSADELHMSFKYFNAFRASLLNIYQLIENDYSLYKAGIKQIRSGHVLGNKINLLQNDFQTFILAASDNRFKTEFLSFWSDFIRPVNNIVLPQNNQSVFISKLNDLNLRLNVLNVVLTKRNKRISPQTKTLLKIIHRRWNNILKVTLKR